MTKQEIEEKIEELENQSFLLDMKDNWTPNDFSKSSHYAIRIKELQNELKNKGDN